MEHSRLSTFKEINIPTNFIPIEKDVSDLDAIDDIRNELMMLKDINITFREIEDDGALALKREDEIKKIEQDLMDLNSIMMDLNELVMEQGDMLDVIELNIDNVHTNTETAIVDLKEADVYQVKTRRTTVGAVGGAVIGGVALGGVGSLIGTLPGYIGGGIGTAGGAISGLFMG